MSENLICKTPKQGGIITVFARTMTKIYDRHFQTFRKIYYTSREFIDALTKYFFKDFWTGLV